MFKKNSLNPEDINNRYNSLTQVLVRKIFNKTKNMADSHIGNSSIANNMDDFVSSLFVKRHKELLMESKDVNIRNIMSPKPDSWLTLIDITQYTDEIRQYNLTPINEELLNNIATRLNTELNFYRNIIKNNVVTAIQLTKERSKTLGDNKTPEDLFAIKLISLFQVSKIVEEKRWLSQMIAIDDIHEDLSMLANKVTQIINVDNLTSDVEIGLTLKEELKAYYDTPNLLSEVRELLNQPTLTGFKSAVSACGVKDINKLLITGIFIKNEILRKTYPDVNEILNVLLGIIKNKYVILSKLYNVYTTNKTLFIGFEKYGEEVVSYALEDSFTELKNNSVALKVMIGALIVKIEEMSKTSTIYDNIFYPLVVTNKAITDKIGLYDAAYDGYRKVRILKAQNKTEENLKSIILFSIIEQTLVSDKKDIVKKQVDKLSINDLSNIETTITNIFKNLYPDSNFDIFINATFEAEKIFDKGTNDVVDYAAIKLISLYILSQFVLK